MIAEQPTSLDWINKNYGLKIRIGMVMKYQGDDCVVTGSEGPHLVVVRKSDRQELVLHPTWKTEYPNTDD